MSTHVYIECDDYRASTSERTIDYMLDRFGRWCTLDHRIVRSATPLPTGSLIEQPPTLDDGDLYDEHVEDAAATDRERHAREFTCRLDGD